MQCKLLGVPIEKHYYKRMKSAPFCIFSFIACLTIVLKFQLYADEEVIEAKAFPAGEIVLPQFLLNSFGEKVSNTVLEKKYVGLYFSASWCGPCRKFTPKLIEFRNKFADELEVILVGGDGNSKAQANYMKKYSMPWLAMENQSSEAKHASKVAEVEFIPYLVILDKKGKIITKNGKNDLMKLGVNAMAHWKDL